MPKLKSHKTVEQIAKKHNLDVAFIQKQLDMGEPIEHEHTKDHTLATDIALQHLDEIPDYYTRLKKMEASAKKEHRKFKDVKEALDEQRYCPLCDKRETRSECSYGAKAWDKVSVKDHEYSMARSELATMSDAIKRLQKKMGKGEGNIEAWVQSKITKAADYIDTAADYVASKEMKEHRGIVAEILKDIQEEDPCWKGYTQVGMKDKNGRKVPNCVPSKGVPKAKGYKKEDVTIEDVNGNTFAEVVDVIKPEPIKGFVQQVSEATRLPATTGNIISVMLNWRGKTYGTKMFFPQTKLPTRKDIEYEIQKVYPDCRILTYKVAEFVPGQALIYVDNTKSKNYLMNNKTIGEETIEEVAAWQRKEGKSESGGLNEKGRKSYERENPGSDLKAPQPEGGSRRNSFCARMKGMKKKLTSAKTANDPDSRINKSLRAWNC
jgi:hypothetical protein